MDPLQKRYHDQLEPPVQAAVEADAGDLQALDSPHGQGSWHSGAISGDLSRSLERVQLQETWLQQQQQQPLLELSGSHSAADPINSAGLFNAALADPIPSSLDPQGLGAQILDAQLLDARQLEALEQAIAWELRPAPAGASTLLDSADGLLELAQSNLAAADAAGLLDQAIGRAFPDADQAALRSAATAFLQGDQAPTLQWAQFERSTILGAYLGESGTILLSDQLRDGPAPRLQAVLLEELGHWLEQTAGLADSPGDEGQIFAQLLLGADASQVAPARGDRDQVWLNLDGRRVAAELAELPSRLSPAPGPLPPLVVGEDSGLSSLGLANLEYTSPDNQPLSVRITALPPADQGRIVLVEGPGNQETPVDLATTYSLDQLRGMQFRTVPDAFTPVEDTLPFFSFEVALAGSAPGTGLQETITIRVLPVNEAPTASGGGSTGRLLPFLAINASALQANAATGSFEPLPLGLGEPANGAAEGGAVVFTPGVSQVEGEEQQLLDVVEITALPPAELGQIVLADGTPVNLTTLYTLEQLAGMQFLPAAGIDDLDTAQRDSEFRFRLRDNGAEAQGADDNQIQQEFSLAILYVSDPTDGAEDASAEQQAPASTAGQSGASDLASASPSTIQNPVVVVADQEEASPANARQSRPSANASAASASSGGGGEAAEVAQPANQAPGSVAFAVKEGYPGKKDGTDSGGDRDSQGKVDDPQPSGKDPRQRGLRLDPIERLASAASAEPGSLMERLNDTNVLGINLMDALALGAGVLYLLFGPMALQAGRGGIAGLLAGRKGAAAAVAGAERAVLALYLMRLESGGQQLMAARVGKGSLTVLAQQDLAASADSSQRQAALQQLLSTLESQRFELLLLDPRLDPGGGKAADQLQQLAEKRQPLVTEPLAAPVASCSEAQLAQLRAWLNKPSSGVPQDLPVVQALQQRQQAYQATMAEEQASMASLVELSLALAWSKRP